MAKMTQADADVIRLNLENNWDELHPTELLRLQTLLSVWEEIKAPAGLPEVPASGESEDVILSAYTGANYIGSTGGGLDVFTNVPDGFYDIRVEAIVRSSSTWLFYNVNGTEIARDRVGTSDSRYVFDSRAQRVSGTFNISGSSSSVIRYARVMLTKVANVGS